MAIIFFDLSFYSNHACSLKNVFLISGRALVEDQELGEAYFEKDQLWLCSSNKTS